MTEDSLSGVQMDTEHEENGGKALSMIFMTCDGGIR
jgi:hypothetical protein